MDPVEKALIEHYKMTPDLARRVAANLRTGGDYTGYEAARPPAPLPASPSGRKGGQAVRPQRSGDDIAQRRIDYYHDLIERQRKGEDIGPENHEWLSKVHAQAGASNIGNKTKSIGRAAVQGGKQAAEAPVELTIPQNALFNSLYNKIPVGDVEATRRYLAGMGGGQFINGIDRGYALSELHPMPSAGAAAPLPQTGQPTLLPNGTYREDTSINPWGVMPDVIKI